MEEGPLFVNVAKHLYSVAQRARLSRASVNIINIIVCDAEAEWFEHLPFKAESAGMSPFVTVKVLEKILYTPSMDILSIDSSA